MEMKTKVDSWGWFADSCGYMGSLKVRAELLSCVFTSLMKWERERGGTLVSGI